MSSYKEYKLPTKYEPVIEYIVHGSKNGLF